MGSLTVQELLDRARQGSHSAVWSLLETCSPRVLRSIRKRLTPRLRHRLDSEDVAQSVWASFFGEIPSPEQFNSVPELVAYVERMACNKMLDVQRAHRRNRRDIGRDVPLDSQLTRELAGHPVTPSHVASQREEWSQLLRGRSERHRRILELRAAGATYEEIGHELDLHPSSVRRIVSACVKASGSSPIEPVESPPVA